VRAPEEAVASDRAVAVGEHQVRGLAPRPFIAAKLGDAEDRAWEHALEDNNAVESGGAVAADEREAQVRWWRAFNGQRVVKRRRPPQGHSQKTFAFRGAP
jgi:hypothetical protein